LTFCDIITNDPVTALRLATTVAAGIRIHLIAIITALKAILTGLSIDPVDPIATRSFNTFGSTGILILKIPIITGFLTVTNMTIAASSRITTVQARVRLALIAIVALLIAGLVSSSVGSPKPIATDRLNAGDATIIIVLVPIITGLKPLLSRLSVRSPDSITTGRELTGVRTIITVDVIFVVTFFAFIDDAIATIFRPAVG